MEVHFPKEFSSLEREVNRALGEITTKFKESEELPLIASIRKPAPHQQNKRVLSVQRLMVNNRKRLVVEDQGQLYYVDLTPVNLLVDPNSEGDTVATASYVTAAASSSLPNERVLTQTANQVIVTDNGAGSTIVLSLPQDIHTAATPTFAGIIISAVTSGNVLVANGTAFVGVTPDSGGLVTKAGVQTISGAKTFSEHVVVSTGKELRLYDADNSNYVGFVAGSLSADKVWRLPLTDGSSGQAMTTDGSGNLSFATVTSNAAGSDTQVQFNDGGTAFGGDAGLTYNKTTNVLTITSGALVTPKIYPASDSTTAIQILKANGITSVLSVDTTNSRIGIGVTPSVSLHIRDASTFGDIAIFEESDGTDHVVLGSGSSLNSYIIVGNNGNKKMALNAGTGGSGFEFDSAGGFVIQAASNANIGNGTGTIGLTVWGSNQNVNIGPTFADPGIKFRVELQNATTNAVDNATIICHNSTGTPAVGFGAGLLFTLESSTTADQSAGRITYEWVVATHASRTARSKWTVYDTAEREGLRIEASGSVVMIGAYGVAAVARPSAYTQTFSTADKTLSAYTADNESGAYSGIDNAQVGTVYAQLADLNALRAAYENLRAFVEDGMQFMNAMCDDLQSEGWLQ